MSYMRFTLPALAFLLTACIGGGGSYKHPSVSGSPTAMSTDTLCYRYATGKKSQALADEVARRGVDCVAIVEADPLYGGLGY